MLTLKYKTLGLAALLFTVMTWNAAAAEQWIHIRVHGADSENVSVNLPVSLLHAASALIPPEVHQKGKIAVDDMNLSWQDLMNFWQAVKQAPQATFVTVESKDQNVEVKKEGNFLLVKTVERSDKGANVDVKLPLTVVDALLSGPEGTFNFQAALTALAAQGTSDIVTVRNGQETVRIWIDDNQTAAE